LRERKETLHNSSLVLLLILAKYIFDGSTNVMTSETWFLLLWPQVSMQNDEDGVQKYAYYIASFIIQCQNIWVMCCNYVVNHWTNVFSANYKFRSVCEHLYSVVFNQLPAKKKKRKRKRTSIGYFQQGNAAAHTADSRLHGYCIQDVFKQNN
jgi:hypothetical protein